MKICKAFLIIDLKPFCILKSENYNIYQNYKKSSILVTCLKERILSYLFLCPQYLIGNFAQKPSEKLIKKSY